jgi:hypothetical protein
MTHARRLSITVTAMAVALPSSAFLLSTIESDETLLSERLLASVRGLDQQYGGVANNTCAAASLTVAGTLGYQNVVASCTTSGTTCSQCDSSASGVQGYNASTVTQGTGQWTDGIVCGWAQIGTCGPVGTTPETYSCQNTNYMTDQNGNAKRCSDIFDIKDQIPY